MTLSSNINEKVDAVFGIVLIICFLACIAILIVKGLFAGDADALDRGINSTIGGGGASGAAVLYMKWKVIRDSKAKLSSDQVVQLINKEKDDSETD